jgi:spoIIIJ-associated protein
MDDFNLTGNNDSIDDVEHVSEDVSEDQSSRETEARELLSSVLELMGYDLGVDAVTEGERVVLSIVGDDADELIGPKGQTLDALQFIVNRALNRKLRERTLVVVDSGGYRQRRIDALRELAERLGDKAMGSGKTVAVNPMSAHDRRVIHMALRETAGISTCSEGEGSSRRVLIVPTSE